MATRRRRTSWRYRTNHAELSDSVATALGTSKADGKKAVDAVFAAIAEAAAKAVKDKLNG